MIFWVSGNCKPFLLGAYRRVPKNPWAHTPTSIIPDLFLMVCLICLNHPLWTWKLEHLNLPPLVESSKFKKSNGDRYLSKREAIRIFLMETGYPRFKYPTVEFPFKIGDLLLIAAQFLAIWCVTIYCSEVWHDLGPATSESVAVSFLFKPSRCLFIGNLRVPPPMPPPLTKGVLTIIVLW